MVPEHGVERLVIDPTLRQGLDHVLADADEVGLLHGDIALGERDLPTALWADPLAAEYVAALLADLLALLTLA
jgi:hypothetical protein